LFAIDCKTRKGYLVASKFQFKSTMKAINLSDLFGQKIYRIPDYQRGYAWGHKQLRELWEDILEISEINGCLRPHYTGTIYVEAAQPEEIERWLTGFTFYNVVDGQQRLTTISILLQVLLKYAGEGYCNETREDLEKAYIFRSNRSGASRIYRFCYFQSDKNYAYLLNKIFEHSGTVFDESQFNLYSKNLSQAKDFFEQRIKPLTSQDREIIFLKVTTALKFDFREIEQDLDVQAVFETMNNRGKPLSTLEKLKNRLMHLTEKLGLADEDRKSLRNDVNRSWGIIYNWLAKNPEQILDEDIFLSAHLSLVRTPKDAVFSEKLAEEKVFEIFSNRAEQYDSGEENTKESPVSYEKIQDYILKLSAFAPKWYEIHNSSHPMINKVLLLNGGKEMKIFLTQLKSFEWEPGKLDQALDKLERIMFRNRIQGLGVIDERSFATWARDIYNGNLSAVLVMARLNEQLDIPVLTANMVNYFNGLYGYERGPKGFHRWGALKYFLFEYEEHLKYHYKETNDKVDLSDFDSTTIEHIIPQEYEANWQQQVSSVFENLTEEHAYHGTKVLLHTLGNLTILKNGKNSSLGNRSWSDKRERFKTGSYNEIDVAISEGWDRETISKRGKDMLTFMTTKIKGLILQSSDIENILFSNPSICSAIRDGKKYEPPVRREDAINQD